MATERAPRLDAIVLAAGSASRFGGAKLMAPWRGGRLIDGALSAALAASVREIVVVTGADAEVTQRIAGQHENRRIRLVHAAEHGLGMSSSLRAGISALRDDCDGVFVFLGDMPLVPPHTASALAALFKPDVDAVAPVHAGRRGHPVLFRRRLFASLAALQGDDGGREILLSLGRRLALAEVSDAGIHLDIDTRTDLDSLG